MDTLSLLAVAQEAGLTVQAVGDKLVVRGPRAAEALVHEIREHKAELLVALRPAASPEADQADADHDADHDGDVDRADQRAPVRPVKRPPPPTDPAGYCPAHGRRLTYAEAVAGGCSWCAQGVPPVARRSWAALPCVDCAGPLPRGNDYRCETCIAEAQRKNEPQGPSSAVSPSRPVTQSSFAVARARALEAGERMAWTGIPPGYGLPVDAGKKAWERIAAAHPEALLRTAEAYAAKLEQDNKEALPF
jgi:hypothetical protein